MTTGTKIVISTAAVLAIVSLFVFRKKVVATAKKMLGSFFVSDSTTGTPDSTDLQKGSGDIQHVMQVQEVLNEIHAATKYTNANCGMSWLVYPGKMPDVSGVFDEATEKALQFYLARKTIDLDYLNLIRGKLAKYNAGDKCKHPLAY